MNTTPSSRLGRLLIVAAIALTSLGVLAAPAVNTLKGGVRGGRGDTAILGYDPVAYFDVSRPVKGQDRFVHEWNGAKWKFSSQANLDRFKADPQKYAPQYGGYCAYGVAQGALVKIEPDKFKIIDGKLYLNYDADVQATWAKDPAGYIKEANTKFDALLAK
jgi:YHS domain-containing protein